MKVRYLGPHDEGDVVWQGREFRVVRDEVCEVPDDLGAVLVANPEQYVEEKSTRRKADESKDES